MASILSSDRRRGAALTIVGPTMSGTGGWWRCSAPPRSGCGGRGRAGEVGLAALPRATNDELTIRSATSRAARHRARRAAVAEARLGHRQQLEHRVPPSRRIVKNGATARPYPHAWVVPWWKEAPKSEAMHVSSVRRTVALVCAAAAIASLMAASPAAGRGTPNTAALQVALKALHHYDGGIDGINGRGTKRAVRRYQRAHRLPVDGVAGPRTRRKLGARGRPSLGSRAMSARRPRLGRRGAPVAAPQARRSGRTAPTAASAPTPRPPSAARRRGTAWPSTASPAPPRSARSSAIAAPAAAPAEREQPDRPRPLPAPGPRPVTSPFGMRWGRLTPASTSAPPSGAPVGAGGRGTVIVRRLELGRLRQPGRDPAPARLPELVRAPLERRRERRAERGGRHADRRTSAPPAPRPAPTCTSRSATTAPRSTRAAYLLRTYAARLAPGTRPSTNEHDHAECLPPGPVETDPAKARLVDCR